MKLPKLYEQSPRGFFLIAVFTSMTISVVCQLCNFQDPEKIGKHFFLH